MKKYIYEVKIQKFDEKTEPVYTVIQFTTSKKIAIKYIMDYRFLFEDREKFPRLDLASKTKTSSFYFISGNDRHGKYQAFQIFLTRKETIESLYYSESV